MGRHILSNRYGSKSSNIIKLRTFSEISSNPLINSKDPDPGGQLITGPPVPALDPEPQH